MNIKGYKVFNEDWTCMGFKYEVGKTYKHDGGIEVCKGGFHFCEKLSSCFNYYEFDPNNKVAEVEVLGLIKTKGDKSVTDEIKIVRELNWYEVLDMVNLGEGDTGYYNTGNDNSGNYNTGNNNSGNWNTGCYNSGHYNNGNKNSGDGNSGFYNAGNVNTGNNNSGNYNTGDKNVGDYNSGNCNTGKYNVGRYNTGHCNIGHCNKGNYNTGHWNKGSYNTGAFNTATPKVYLFNKPTEWTMEEWMKSEAYKILEYNSTLTKWIWEEEMTNKEKEENPNYRIREGYLKVFTYEEMCKNMWNRLTHEEREIIKLLPNFDKDIFEEITGIRL